MARRYMPYVLLLVAVGSFAFAGLAYLLDRPEEPALAVDTTKYVFDLATVDTDLTATFRFTNTGRHPIRVLSIGTC